MKIVFCSNFFNHHQLYVSTELYNSTGIEYTFVATEPIPEERLKLGYENMNSKYSFIIRAYESEEEKEKAIKICNECDILIIGSAPRIYEKDRIDKNRLTFRYSERIFKKGFIQLTNPKTLASLVIDKFRCRKKNVFMLCASAYTPFDFSLVGAYKNKCYKWGYFPESKVYDIQRLIERKEQNPLIEILWVARFIDWKHPELIIELAKKLKEKGYKFKIKMIGTGPLEENIKILIENKQLSQYVELVGAIPSSQVREYMEKANIFISTSDQNEGWGAVINEAMNSACVVIANRKIGAVPYLIQNEQNGLHYVTKEELIQKVEMVIHDTEKRKNIGSNAYKTIIHTWNAKKAVENFLHLVSDIQNKKDVSIQDGPCSKAEIIK